MNRNMRLAIDSMIERRVISANLLFLCLARLNEIIMTRAANTTKQEQQRVIIAKAALSIGVDKETIRDKMQSIDQSCFPTDRKITEICEYIESGYCGIDDSAIADRWLKYKSAEQIEHDMQRQKAKRETQQTSRSTFDCSDPDFIELCDFLESVFMPGLLNPEMLYIQESDRYILTAEMKQRLHTLKTDQYDFALILDCFKRYEYKIMSWYCDRVSDDASDFVKFKFLCGIVKNKLPDMVKSIRAEQAEREAKNEREKHKNDDDWNKNAQPIVNGELSLDEAIYIQCEKYDTSVYYGQHDYVREQLLLAIERVKNGN